MCYNRDMAWKEGQYYYSIKGLRAIASGYRNIYEGLSFREGALITNPWLLVEFKVDFDRALGEIGKGDWDGKIMEFKYYRNFGKFQRIVIADILEIDDGELTRLGFYDINRLKGYSYYLMANYLNGGINVTESNT